LIVFQTLPEAEVHVPIAYSRVDGDIRDATGSSPGPMPRNASPLKLSASLRRLRVVLLRIRRLAAADNRDNEQGRGERREQARSGHGDS